MLLCTCQKVDIYTHTVTNSMYTLILSQLSQMQTIFRRFCCVPVTNSMYTPIQSRTQWLNSYSHNFLKCKEYAADFAVACYELEVYTHTVTNCKRCAADGATDLSRTRYVYTHIHTYTHIHSHKLDRGESCAIDVAVDLSRTWCVHSYRHELYRCK